MSACAYCNGTGFVDKNGCPVTEPGYACPECDGTSTVLATPSDATKLAQRITPGPWTNERMNGYWSVLGPDRNGTSCPIAAIVASCPEAQANAALIARAPDLLAQLAQVTAERDEMKRALEAIVDGLSQPVQTCEPSARTATILLGDCTFARQTAKNALEMFMQ